MSKSQDFYWTKSLVRNNKEMISLNIELTHVVVD